MALLLWALGSAQAKAVGSGSGATEITCTHVTFTYEGFANAEGNTVTEVISAGHEVLSRTTFVFNGPSGSNTVAIVAPPGKYLIDAHAVWNTNGVKGGFDHHAKANCQPGFSVQKRQRVQGSQTGFSTSPQQGKVGQTVEYEIVVTNTGMVSLSFSGFADPHCDEGTISGGPGEASLAPGASSTYTCSHVLAAIGPYTNEASVTGTAASGPPITHTTNKVIVEVPPEPGFAIEKLQEIQGSGGGFTTAPVGGQVGQTVDYQIVVTNTGNVPLSFSSLTDLHCDKGTIAGGPGESALAPGASATYTCTHLLASRDAKNGSYENTATIKATPPPGDGPPVTKTSNTVVVTIAGGVGRPEITCRSVTFTYTGFPEAEGNTVNEVVTSHGQVLSSTVFTFNGSSGTNTVTIETSPGKNLIDAHASWNTNGAKGGFDRHVNITC